MPTKHGFDEFFGNLYHLNAEEEPEGYFYPKDPEFKKKFGPRGVIHSWANADGTQKVEDTGPLNTARMPTVDEEFLGAAQEVHRQRRRRRQAVLRVVQHHAHACLHAPEEGVARQDRARASMPTAWWSTTATWASCWTNSTT